MKFIALLGLIFGNGYFASRQVVQNYIPETPTQKTRIQFKRQDSRPVMQIGKTSMFYWPKSMFFQRYMMLKKYRIVPTYNDTSYPESNLEEQIKQTTQLIKELLSPESPKTTRQICHEILKFSELLTTYPKLKPVIEHQYQSPNLNKFLEEYGYIDFKTELPKAVADKSYQLIEEFNKASYWDQGLLYLRLQKKFK